MSDDLRIENKTLMKAAFERYQELYPDIDETAFNWGYVAAINDLVNHVRTARGKRTIF